MNNMQADTLIVGIWKHEQFHILLFKNFRHLSKSFPDILSLTVSLFHTLSLYYFATAGAADFFYFYFDFEYFGWNIWCVCMAVLDWKLAS